MVTFASSNEDPAVTVFGDATVHGTLYVNGVAVDASGGVASPDSGGAAQDLAAANLTAATLTVSQDLTAANLTAATLTVSQDLAAANLTAANLTAANLTAANLTVSQAAVLDGAVTLRANVEFASAVAFSAGDGDAVRLRYKPEADALPPGFQVDSPVNLVFASQYTAFAGQLNALNDLVVNGTGTLAGLCHTGETAGFFGAPAATKPVVSGTWGPDATAGPSLAAALAALGLVDDQTTTAAP